MQPRLTVARRVEVWDRALQRIRETLRGAGMREVSAPVETMPELVRQGSGPIFLVRHGSWADEKTLRPREDECLVTWFRTDSDADALIRDILALTQCCFDAAEQCEPLPWRQQSTLHGESPSLPMDDRTACRLESAADGVAGATIAVDRVLVLACGAEDTPGVAAQVEAALPARDRGRAVDRASSLVALGLVKADELPQLEAVETKLAVAITPTMLSVLKQADDPIGRQFVPDVRELHVARAERRDPIGDDLHTVVPGLIQRYPDRVLLKPTHLCAVYCRFCFRRDVVGDPDFATLSPDELAGALSVIRQRPSVWEVILTGGDPLVLAPARLAAIIASLNEIPHVRVIRMHTRVPLVAPERVTPALVRALRGAKPVYVVLHANHVTEFTPAGAAACAALVDGGIPMLSQSVLLKGVNDSPEALEELLRELVVQRIKPYYLHHPDLVEGTGHLRVPLETGRALVRGLRGRVSGLCQPTYVLDIPGGHGKVPAEAAWIEGPDTDGRWDVTDPAGAVHRYDESD